MPERLLMTALMKGQRAQLKQVVAARMGDQAFASFVGAAFEEMFHIMMESGCYLECRDLETEDAKPFMQEFKKCAAHMILDEADLSSNEAANYFIPFSTTFGVDAILQPDSLFQVTTADIHEVPATGLEAALQLLPESTKYKLYFVVPENRFEGFKKKQIAGTTGTELQVLEGRVANVKQYVLKCNAMQCTP